MVSNTSILTESYIATSSLKTSSSTPMVRGLFDRAIGYLKITDFGIARVWNPENSHDTSGTPGYMAPEVMCRQNHGVAADYFAVGVIAYECMFGKVRDECATHLEAVSREIAERDQRSDIS